MDETIVQLAETLFRDFPDPADRQDRYVPNQSLWTAWCDSGLGELLHELQESDSQTLATAVAIARRAGYFAVRAPVVESMLGGYVRGAVCVTSAKNTISEVLPAEGLWIVHGATSVTVDQALNNVPWARWATALITIPWPNLDAQLHQATWVEWSGDQMHGAVTIGSNLADEPRDTVRPKRVRPLVLPVGITQFVYALGAVLMAARMHGAAQRILELTTEHAAVRKQFGRPLLGFQAVQQMLAQLAGQVVASGAAVDQALAPVQANVNKLNQIHTMSAMQTMWTAGIAKGRVSEAVGNITELAHEIFGALGYTREHSLQRYTRLLWAARDEWGSESFWYQRAGSRLLQEQRSLWDCSSPDSAQ